VTTAYLALGSNLGDRAAFLQSALDGLARADDVRVTEVSRVYETEPVGGPAQGAYLNAVVAVETGLAPHALLALAQQLERDAQRVRGERFGPRTLDVDVLWVESGPVDDPDLVIPHPRMAERRFVMAPLADLAPDLVPDDWNDRAEGRVRRVGPLKD